MQKTRGSYRSKPREEIIRHLKLWAGEFLTVEEIAERLAKAEVRVGLTTIYRTLRLLEETGDLVKVPDSDGLGAQYSYLGKDSEESPYGKLQCRDCGQTSSLDCGQLNDLIEHIEHDHHFQISKAQTLFYGLCEDCSEEEEKTKDRRKGK